MWVARVGLVRDSSNERKEGDELHGVDIAEAREEVADDFIEQSSLWLNPIFHNNEC